MFQTQKSEEFSTRYCVLGIDTTLNKGYNVSVRVFINRKNVYRV